VSSAKAVIFLIGDDELAGISECLPRVVLPSNHQDLEALPTIRLKLFDMLVHIFIPIESTYHSVNLELNAILLTPGSNLV
jgi:hypothetical protein